MILPMKPYTLRFSHAPARHSPASLGETERDGKLQP